MSIARWSRRLEAWYAQRVLIRQPTIFRLEYWFFDKWIWRKRNVGGGVPAEHQIEAIWFDCLNETSANTFRECYKQRRCLVFISGVDGVLKNVLVNFYQCKLIFYAWPDIHCVCLKLVGLKSQYQTWEFDPGSERTLAAGLTHASRTPSSEGVADGWVTRGNLPSTTE